MPMMIQIWGDFLQMTNKNGWVKSWNFGIKKHPNLPQYQFFRSFGQKTWKWEPKLDGHGQPLDRRPHKPIFYEFHYFKLDRIKSWWRKSCLQIHAHQPPSHVLVHKLFRIMVHPHHYVRIWLVKRKGLHNNFGFPVPWQLLIGWKMADFFETCFQLPGGHKNGL